jgi:hypothetical protein
MASPGPDPDCEIADVVGADSRWRSTKQGAGHTAALTAPMVRRSAFEAVQANTHVQLLPCQADGAHCLSLLVATFLEGTLYCGPFQDAQVGRLSGADGGALWLGDRGRASTSDRLCVRREPLSVPFSGNWNC